MPAVVLLKHLLDEGKFGRIFHYRAKFLQDWTISEDLPQGGEGLWRLDVKVAGSGVTGDLLAHCIDTALWLNGSITEVTAMTETFIKERKHNLTGKVEPVGIDDASAFLCRFKNGSLATFESTRYARGHKALYTLEINGEHASAFWDLHDLHRIQYFDHKDEGRVRGWRSVHVTDGDHPYMKQWWVPGLQIGYEHTFIHQFADFVQAVGEGKSARADVPRRPGNRLRHRRRAEVGEHQALGNRSVIEGEPDVQNRRRSRVGRRRRRQRCSCQAAAPIAAQQQPPAAGAQPPPAGQTAAGAAVRAVAAEAADARPAAIAYRRPHRLRADLRRHQPEELGRRSRPSGASRAASIVGESTEANPVKQNTFLIYRGGEPADFELKVEFRINASNSGIQYRSVQVPPDEEDAASGS